MSSLQVTLVLVNFHMYDYVGDDDVVPEQRIGIEVILFYHSILVRKKDLV